MPINSKKKGNHFERMFTNWLKNNGVDPNAHRNSLSGAGVFKSDVHNNLGLNLEVKAGKAISLPKAIQQSQRDAEKTRTTPYVVLHYDGMAEDTFHIVMSNWDWLELWRKAQEPKQVATTTSRNDRFVLERAKKALQDALKLLS